MNMEDVIAKSNTETLKRNAEFEAMTPAQKRVTLAQDVLQQLSLERFRATRGIYFNHQADIVITADDSERDLSEFLPKIESCEVCAIGSLFVCAVMRADKLKVGHELHLREDGPTPLRELSFDEPVYVGQFFPYGQRKMMEDMFEWSYAHDEEGRYVTLPARWDTNAGARLTWIMENVIANEGLFDPRWDNLELPVSVEVSPPA